MGSLTSLATLVPVIKEGVDTITGLSSREASRKDAQKDQRVALSQLQKTQQLNQQNAEENAALQRERLAADATTAENTRLSALRRAVARQRASFGAQGVGSSSGSSGAVLLGLFDESEDELAQRERLDNIRKRSLDLGLSQQRGINTLQFTQLKERQKLGRLSANVDRVGSLVNDGFDLFGTGISLSKLI